ncbi:MULTISPECIES: hypothetical protein [unclassified Lysinibacillus]|uniref:hypothetical protein n=1 Tax=unclassified Lysinibacillus TaxID=2636778 RepID=UPI0020130957|nr:MULTISPECIES: hypothetical protein [unclassified Lysinibacillus]MCL1695137.1 hypothetical protein [Lysinibacillus sp. BPa_S21]MCL1701193.1 hypothetical protein [Lysinibacillus sp. Bpr_S20]
MMFKDPWNPTQKEIKKWAYSDEMEPVQDWELAIYKFENIPMICTFVEDEQCKHTSYFLNTLYVFTGDTVRGEDRGKIQKLSQLLGTMENTAESKELQLWIERSQLLIEYPEYYHSSYWGLCSRFVYENLESGAIPKI